jgi:hypothetical protein
MSKETSKELGEQVIELKRLIRGYQKECSDVEQALGVALDYQWFRDDQKNFPNATDADGVCIGEHTPGSIAMEAAQKIVGLKTIIKDLDTELNDVSIYIDHQQTPPHAYQGKPDVDYVDIATADDVNRWINYLHAARGDVIHLQGELAKLRVENAGLGGKIRAIEQITHSQNVDHGIYKTRAEHKLAFAESMARIALRIIVNSEDTAITGVILARARSMLRLLDSIPVSNGLVGAIPLTTRAHMGQALRANDLAEGDYRVDVGAMAQTEAGTRGLV